MLEGQQSPLLALPGPVLGKLQGSLGKLRVTDLEMPLVFPSRISCETSTARKKSQGSSDRCDFSCGYTVDRSGGLKGLALSCSLTL